jgi:hypothetical protein
MVYMWSSAGHCQSYMDIISGDCGSAHILMICILTYHKEWSTSQGFEYIHIWKLVSWLVLLRIYTLSKTGVNHTTTPSVTVFLPRHRFFLVKIPLYNMIKKADTGLTADFQCDSNAANAPGPKAIRPKLRPQEFFCRKSLKQKKNSPRPKFCKRPTNWIKVIGLASKLKLDGCVMVMVFGA